MDNKVQNVENHSIKNIFCEMYSKKNITVQTEDITNKAHMLYSC